MATGIFCVLKAMRIRHDSIDEDIHNPYRTHKPGNYLHLYSHFVVMTVHLILSHKLGYDCMDAAIPVFCTNDWFYMLKEMLSI